MRHESPAGLVRIVEDERRLAIRVRGGPSPGPVPSLIAALLAMFGGALAVLAWPAAGVPLVVLGSLGLLPSSASLAGRASSSSSATSSTSG